MIQVLFLVLLWGPRELVRSLSDRTLHVPRRLTPGPEPLMFKGKGEHTRGFLQRRETKGVDILLLPILYVIRTK